MIIRKQKGPNDGSVLIICIFLIVFSTMLLTSFIRSMGRYRGAAVSDIYNTYAELAMRNGQIHAIHTLQRAALVDDPDHPDFYSTFQSSWRNTFRRDKTLEPGGEFPDATANLGSATWQLPEHNVPCRSATYRTYGPADKASRSDRLSDGMLQVIGIKKDGQSTQTGSMQFSIGANAGARWYETDFLDDDGQVVEFADKDDARFVVRYAVEMLDLSGFMGFNFYPEENIDWSTLSATEALEKRRHLRALRERFGTIHMAHLAEERNHPWSKLTYNVLPRSSDSDTNSRSIDPKFLAFRHYLEPNRLEDSPFKVEMDNWSSIWAPQVASKFSFWSFHRAAYHQVYDLFQGHGQIWTGNMNALVYKTQVNPGPYYSYQNLASAMLEAHDTMDDMFYRPHTYNLYDSGLSVENGDDCYTPFRLNILTSTSLSLENAFQRHVAKLSYVPAGLGGGPPDFAGPGLISFPFALGDPLIPFSNDPAASDMYDDNFVVGQEYTFANTADAPPNSTLDTWFERTGSMYQWFYAMDYNEGRQLGPRYRAIRQGNFIEGYGNLGLDTPLGPQLGTRFPRRRNTEYNTSQAYEQDVMEALVCAVLGAKKVWSGEAQRHRYGWESEWQDNTRDYTIERLQEIWEDWSWIRTGGNSTTISDIDDSTGNELATIHDVERLFLRILGEKININDGNARGNNRAYDRQDPTTWRALPRALAGRSIQYPDNWYINDDRVKEDHVIPTAHKKDGNGFRYFRTPESTRLRDHQNTAGMERFLNDIRMSYFGSPAIDFNFDGFAESSVNGWNDGGDGIQTWMNAAAKRGGQKAPDLDVYGPGSRDANGVKFAASSGNAAYQTLRDQHIDWMQLDEGTDNSRKYGFSSAGRLYMGKSQAYRIFVRGQVWDLVRNKKTSEVNLDFVYSPNPSDNPTTYRIEDTDLADSHMLMQRPIRNYQMVYSEDNFTE